MQGDSWLSEWKKMLTKPFLHMLWWCLCYTPKKEHCRYLQYYHHLKGQCPEIFCFSFFHESVSPQPQCIPLGLFQTFSKNRGDIRKSMCITGSNDTWWQDIRKSRWTTGINNTCGKLATGVNLHGLFSFEKWLVKTD